MFSVTVGLVEIGGDWWGDYDITHSQFLHLVGITDNLSIT